MKPVALPERCFGTPGAETLRDDLTDVLIDDYGLGCDEPIDDDHAPFIVEEWTVRPSRSHLPSAADLIEWVEDHADEVDDHVEFHRDGAQVRVADLLIDLIADSMDGWMAGDFVAEHVIDAVHARAWLAGIPAGSPPTDQALLHSEGVCPACGWDGDENAGSSAGWSGRPSAAPAASTVGPADTKGGSGEA